MGMTGITGDISQQVLVVTGVHLFAYFLDVAVYWRVRLITLGAVFGLRFCTEKHGHTESVGERVPTPVSLRILILSHLVML